MPGPERPEGTFDEVTRHETFLSQRQRDLVAATVPLVESIAKSLKRVSALPIEDLVSAGNEAAARAALRYEPELGVPFGGYAFKRIRGAMLRDLFSKRLGHSAARQLIDRMEADAASRHDAMSSSALYAARASLVARCAGKALAGVMGCFDELDARSAEDDAVAREHQLREAIALREVLETLTPEHRALVQAFYVEEKTIDEAAEKLGLSRATTRRERERVKELIEKRLRMKGVTRG